MRAWENYIRKVVPYVPGEQPKIADVIKLNTNENPYPPSPKAVEASEHFDYDRLRLYPDPEASLLVEAIADRYALDKNQVFVGVGSDDVIAMAFMTFFNSELPILFPDVSYSFYSVWADLFRIPYKKVELDEEFNIVPESFNVPNGGIIFPNPNAPTSVYLGLDKVEEIIKNNQDSVVMVDEAYIDFGGKSAYELINKYDNLLVIQTYSKSRSMAGMRIGFAMGNAKLIKALNDVKFSYNSYTMNETSLVYGSEAMKDEEYFKECVDKIIATREQAKEKLTALGFTYPDSKANFIFAKHERVQASVIFEELKKRNIFVRYFKQPRIDNYLRITVGTDAQMDKLFEALEEIISNN
ncbi:MAG: histidinol-phosphate transaminase [Lachnospira sp.]|nr:histidinol-phosphate transaminase [Lachnospira sp.]